MSCTSFSDFLEVTDDALAGNDKKRDGHLCGHYHYIVKLLYNISVTCKGQLAC